MVGYQILANPRALEGLEVKTVYADPDAGRVLPEDFSRVYITSSPAEGSARYIPYLAPPGEPRYSYGLVTALNKGPPTLTYIQPLGEWVDLFEFRLRIRPEAVGLGEVPLAFTIYPQFNYYHSYGEFGSSSRDAEFCEGRLWQYEPTVWTDGKVTILGEGDPLPPPEPPIDPEDAKIRFSLGFPGCQESEGEPDEGEERPKIFAQRGDTIEVPLYLESAVNIWRLETVVGFDPDQLHLKGVALDFIDLDGLPYTKYREANYENLNPLRVVGFHNFECVPSPGGSPFPDCSFDLFPRG